VVGLKVVWGIENLSLMWMILLSFFSIAYLVLFWVGLYKLAGAKKVGFFILGIIISPVAVVSAFLKLKRRT